MKLMKLLATFLATLAFAGNASAALYTGSTGSPANVVTDYSAPSLVSFDLDLANFSSTTLNFTVEADDLASPFLSLSALVRNLTGINFPEFHFYLNGISFANAGSITPTFGRLSNSGFSDTAAWMKFHPAEPAEFHFGNPFAETGKSDWLLNLSGLQAGDSFSITAAVPEPGTLALLLAGLSLFGFAGRRKGN